MSVKRCARAGCHHVMCDRLSQKYGYLCNSCYQELVTLVTIKGYDGTVISEFMESEPGIGIGLNTAEAIIGAEFSITDF